MPAKTPRNLTKTRRSLIAALYHSGGFSYEDIGVIMNVTRQRIEQIISEDKEKVEKIREIVSEDAGG